MAIEDLTNLRLKELRDKCKYLYDDLSLLLASRPTQDNYSDNFSSENKYLTCIEDSIEHPSKFYCLHILDKYIEIRINKREKQYYIYSFGFDNSEFLSRFFLDFKDSAYIDCSKVVMGPFDFLKAVDVFNSYIREYFSGKYYKVNELL